MCVISSILTIFYVLVTLSVPEAVTFLPFIYAIVPLRGILVALKFLVVKDDVNLWSGWFLLVAANSGNFINLLASKSKSLFIYRCCFIGGSDLPVLLVLFGLSIKILFLLKLINICK